ncbi:MAG: queuosine precursor transporter [Rhodospirillales bacterium]|nr:queuosine precursor transporter [Rhodospirillales bacterium]
MMNEFLFLVTMFFGLAAVPFAAFMGKAWLQGYVVMIMLLLGITDAKVVLVFGLPITLGTALYATIFLATDVLNENYGKKAAYETVRISVFAAILFQVFLQAIRLAVPADDVAALSAAMDTVFATSFRIVFAGLFVYLLSQSLDVWLYDKIRTWTDEKYMWLRNNGSTMISQFFDTFAFAFLAFYGMFDGWLQLAAVAYSVKVLVALWDTPFAYLSRYIVRLSTIRTSS